jgi:hypothetical protein
MLRSSKPANTTRTRTAGFAPEFAFFVALGLVRFLDESMSLQPPITWAVETVEKA